ncbi:Calpain catalytic domain-containing protein [Caenorhabditis elegans]|uniref:Calpain catalytic domain-containing protein n=1 Tax=Caenorhabditis elegans TaxID=6239 RepID=A0A8S4QGE5_CAEEL|nr:Calpain catalytic domain-containing protein [Caenorhabditis elegans]CAH2125330.1 Calpain catalytic domain-containing protein [Caenorhabditis elegans]
MSHGIVQIRLLINGEWKVLKIDFHLPQKSNSFERYAYMVKKQIWVAFIEKGFAKIRKSYEKLSGGVAGIALQQLTGAMTFSVFMEKFNNDENRVWEFIQENRNSKFILTVSTPTIEEESEKKQLLEEYGIRDCHEYSVLDAQVYMGHRLILLAGSGPFGKPKSVRRWGHLPSYKEIREDWCAVDLGFSEFGTFWIDMSELFQYFEYVTVCQYREKWKEIRIRRNVVANTKNTE